MISSVQSLLAFVFVLGVMIFVHELGHYLMAKRIGIRVIVFSLGFGPRLIGFRRGDTDYRVSALPLGGYVKMAGENPEEALSGARDEFMSRSKFERFLVLVMGPAMNIVLAVVLMAVALTNGAEVPIYESQPVVVGTVKDNSPAAQAGIRPGDRITGIDGRDIPTWAQFQIAIGTNPRRALELAIVRGGDSFRRTIVPESRTKYDIGDIGVAPLLHPQVRAVNPGEPADRAGIHKGDIVLRANGREVLRTEELQKAINQSAGQPLTLSVERGTTSLDVSVTPAPRGGTGLIGIQISPVPVRLIQPGPIRALGMSLQRNYEFGRLIFDTVGRLLTRTASVKQLMGPIEIARASGTAAREGLTELLSFMAAISLNLGILNLLPVPVLDGGHIFIMALEGAARRDFSIRVKERVFLAGFILLMMLMITVIYNDLMRMSWFEGLLPWK